MSIKLSGSNDSEKLASLCQQTYKNQAIWFLNAFWDQFQAEAPKLWKIVGQCADLDAQRHGDGNGLDEVQAHRLLELLGETLTVEDRRHRQTERPKTVPLTHYILWRYEVDWHVLVNTTGDNSEEIAKAQQLLDQVSAAFQEADRQAQLSRQAEAHAKSEEAQAISKENYAREQEAPFKAAQEEVDAALADVNAQESARDSRTAELQRKSTEGGIVQQNKAKAELAQHLAEDPLPLRKAKITLEAALKRAEKARAPFEAATQAAVAARQAAEQARREAEVARQAAEAALDDARQKVEEAEAYLAEVKAKPGSPLGAIWWMETELEEQKKYLPSSKGGVAKRG
ncbi:TolAlike protein [Acanthamoeba castellanii str. Neff]|uniref:TolAlike protein n=1 Tax=Acanthamoeba castellanii (strain ATCC 30010 / Neff) TaxID=1257118 RepID=L8H5F3_ACACF|nr:TolAlike protein [Acanthamoeba castellanii str. Neff]ELR19671.1 TolAlike protein [Acanthamoeba castellanii str. Neff]